MKSASFRGPAVAALVACLLAATAAWAQPPPLTQETVDRCLQVYARADQLRTSAITDREEAEKASFGELLRKMQHIMARADRQACEELGVELDSYHDTLARLVNVQAYLQHSEFVAQLEAEIERRSALTEEDLTAEAARSEAELEGWFAEHESGLTEARAQIEEEKRLYLQGIEEENRRIEAQNRERPPSEKRKRLEAQREKYLGLLDDARLAPHHDAIRKDLAEIDEVIERVRVREERDTRQPRKPSPVVLGSFDRKLKSAEQYVASLDEAVMEPAEARKAAGHSLGDARAANSKKIRELRASLAQLSRELDRPELRQGRRDAPAVLHFVEREALMGLDGSSLQKLPDLGL